MIILSIIYFLSFSLSIWSVYFVLRKNPYSSLNQSCALLSFCLAMWAFCYTFLTISVFKQAAVFWLNTASFSWASLSSFLLYFLLVFSKKEKILKKNIVIFSLFFIPLVLIYGQWRDAGIIGDLVKTNYGWSYVWSESIWKYIFYAYFFSFLLTGLYFCNDFKSKTKKASEKKQGKIVIAAIFIPLCMGVITDIVLPEFKIYIIPPIAIIFSVSWMGGLVYAVTKYGLMVITPAGAAEDILAAMTESLILVNSDREVVRVNRATLDLLGFTEEELIGKSINTILKENSLFKGSQFSRLISEGRITDYEIVYYTKSGKEIPVNFSGAALRDEQNNFIGIVGIAKDMRKIRGLIANLEKAKEELEQSNSELALANDQLRQSHVQLVQSAKMAAVGQLGAGVAHELNNPLGGILGYAQFVLEKLKRPEFTIDDFKSCRHYLETVERQATRCKKIVANLLKFSRKSISSKPQRIDANEVIGEVLSLIGHQLTLKNIKVITELEHDLAKVEAVANELQQVFTNIILNAQQAMLSGGTLTISTRLLREMQDTPLHLYGYRRARTRGEQLKIGFVEISFKDTGYGISEEDLPKVFEPFFTTKEREKGTGLGLSVSYQIIEKFKGSIRAVSRGKDKGAAFIITLPAI